jgi:chromodomain-helicase-DNA-binding protein 4
MDDDELAGDDLESILKHGAQALFNDDYEKKSIHYDSAAVDALLDRTGENEAKADDGTSFSYAKVWSNDKSGFEAGLATEEMAEPEAINSSVWDRILAQREAEAQRQAEANREVIGRGGRRRQAINYKTETVNNPVPGDPEADSADSSDDFAGGDSGDESEDDPSVPKGAEADAILELQNPKARGRKGQQLYNQQVENSSKPRQKTTAKQQQQNQWPTWKNGGPQNTNRQGNSQENRTAIPTSNPYQQSGGQMIPGDSTDLARYTMGNNIYQGYDVPPVPHQRVLVTQSHHPPPPNQQIINFRSGNLHSEAEVRLALDFLHHSSSDTGTKERQRALLLGRLKSFTSESAAQRT